MKPAAQELHLHHSPDCGRQPATLLRNAGCRPCLSRVGEIARKDFVVASGRGTSSCVQNHKSRLRLQRSSLPHREVKSKSLPHPEPIIQIGLEAWRGPCSARNRGSRCTTLSAPISRSALAKNTSPRLRHHAGSRPAGFCSSYSTATRASRFSGRSCLAAPRRGGPILSSAPTVQRLTKNDAPNANDRGGE